MPAFRWITKNLGTLVLSLILAIAVWASAVVTSDPNQDDTLQPVPLEITGQAHDLILTNKIPDSVKLTLKAPRSIWELLRANQSVVRAWIDLSGLAAGEHELPVNYQVDLSPVRKIKVEPAAIDLVLEQLVAKEIPIHIQVKGDPPLGYRKGTLQILPETATITGPASAVERVVDVIGNIDATGASQNVKVSVPIRAVDENGVVVPDVSIDPKEASLLLPISIMGGYKNVAVKVLTSGQLADGYRLTNISVTPPTVTVYSTDPQLVNELPGYVETIPVALNDLSDDTEFNAALNLPDGISLVSEPSVLVQVGVAAIEGSLTLTLPVEPLGLPPALIAQISPPTVDVIVLGPLPILDTLTPASFRVVVDLTNLEEGVYQIAPTLDLAPEEVRIQAIIPETVEVTILPAPTATPTGLATPVPVSAQPKTPTPTGTKRP